LITWNCDFGDAPDNGITFFYRTYFANNGARHIVNPNVFLGSCIDVENNGIPNILANGDDNQNTGCTDDEDGVTFLSNIVPGQYVNISVVASVQGYLDAWMDYDHSGDWAGSNKHIFDKEYLSNPTNYLSFLVPSAASLGATYVRFRFRTDNSVISYTGPVIDGEVEDYMVNIIPPQPIFIQQNSVNPSCHGLSNGGVNITVSGGIGPYGYVWSNGVSTMNLGGVNAGTYTVTVTDSQGSTATTSTVLTEPADIVLQTTTVPATCPDATDGSIDLSVSGGTPNYGYYWSNTATSQDIGSLTAGTYSVTVTDAHSCIKSGSYSVTLTSPVCQNRYAQNDDVADTRCYDATWTIYVAGLPPTNPTTFKVENGGNVTMIAGNNIIFYPGTKVYSGGYIWGYIAPNGPWCPARPVSMVDVPPQPEIQNSPVAEKSFFTVYPNPTTGGFSLELKGIDEASELQVEIYGMQGDQVFSTEVRGKRKYDFSLAGKPAGVYFIRVVTGKFAGTSKIIKQ
jgi:hypothetical protein